MIRPILLWPDPALSQKCAPVADIDDEVRTLCDDLLETMYDAPGRGLAAPQIGVLARVFVMDTKWKEGARDPRVFINPKITQPSKARQTGPEGCLSIPDVTADIERAEAITLSWTALDGSTHVERLAGFDAICAQHEFDHLEGIVTFDRLPSHQRQSLEASYFA
ncbi:MAG: peptide deformylase [Boseongicola sp.]|nr:peptide deformylase [Boseongicola sp.]NNJ68934.1 peptide deformylase [Boseongicola sp.]